ncbi:MAG TPA: hypothetical protein VJ955_01655 [Desulfuromonadales bacterium]|nr:hypothetical protein [Desulfuromonadales bacterium]
MIWQKHALRAVRFVLAVTAAVILAGCAHTTLNDLIHSHPSDSADEQAIHERMANLKAQIAHLQTQLAEVQSAPEQTATTSGSTAASATGSNHNGHPWQLVTRLGEEEANHPLYSYVLFSTGSQPLSAVDAKTRDSLANFLDEVRTIKGSSQAPLFVVPAVLANAKEQPALTNYNAGLAVTLFDRVLSGARTSGRPAGMFLLVTPAPLQQLEANVPRLLVDCTSLPDSFREKLLQTVAAPVASGSAAARLSNLTWALVGATGPGTPAMTLRHSGPLIIADWLR